MNIYHKIGHFLDREAISGRYKDGRRDLVKGLPMSQPISTAQREEILSYWKPYLNNWIAKYSWDMRWYDIYNKTNVFDFDLRRYIPDSYYYCVIDRFFNKSQAAPHIDDKNLYDLYFHDIPQPKTICRKEGDVFLDAAYNIVNEQKVLELCANTQKVILKPSVATCAGGVLRYGIAQKIQK